MANLNLWAGSGNLTRDPETRHVSSKGEMVAVTKIGLAVNGINKDKPLYIDVEFWGRKAELVADTLAKGSRINAYGELALDTWDDKAGGGKRSRHYIKAINFQYLDPKNKEVEEGPAGPSDRQASPSRKASSPPPPPPASDEDEDDIPF